MSEVRKLVTLGMFIIDEFAFLDTTGWPTGRTLPPQEEYTPPISHALARLSFSLDFRLGEAALMPTLALASGKVSPPPPPHPPSKRGVPTPVRTDADGTHCTPYGDAAFVNSLEPLFQGCQRAKSA